MVLEIRLIEASFKAKKRFSPQLVDALASHPVEENEVGYPLLEMKVTTSCGEKRFLALNEASIKRISKTMEAEVCSGASALRISGATGSACQPRPGQRPTASPWAER